MTKRRMKLLITVCAACSADLLILSLYGPVDFPTTTDAFCFSPKKRRTWTSLKMAEEPFKDKGIAGSFFHQVPGSNDKSSADNEKGSRAANEGENKDDESETMNQDIVSNDSASARATTGTQDEDSEFEAAVSKLIRQRRKPPRARQPSTINGVPTEKATGFGKSKRKGESSSKKKRNNKPYIAIGQPDLKAPINDPSKPERDDQGYTLYTDTETGEKSRVFEALVEYPSVFPMKIVGANEGMFVQEIVALVAEACESNVDDIKHTTKINGKWVSVTVQAPVSSAEMLYALYEKVDLDPRVRFKF